MELFDILIVDIQNVGLRFYTYCASMVRLMDACAEYYKKMVIFDCSNLNGFYMDGPVLYMKHKSFFENLIGVDYVRKMIEEGKSADEIKAMWKNDVEKFKIQRKPYLLYEE
jgi:uncharacterized protein YbbC (DUF1343 family)